MGSEVLLAIIGVVSTLMSALVGWLTGRRKNKADASLVEADVLEKLREFYRKSQEDTNKKLQGYIDLSNKNTIQINNQREQIMELTQLIYEVLNNITVDNEFRNKVVSRIRQIDSLGMDHDAIFDKDDSPSQD